MNFLRILTHKTCLVANQILNEVEPLSGKNGCLGSELEHHGEEEHGAVRFGSETAWCFVYIFV
jgi:hypothetical protein